MNHFLVDILTPEKVVAQDIPAESLLIPTERGQINLLPEHTHLITRIGTGELTVMTHGDGLDRVFTVTHGICKVLDNKVRIMSHTSEEKSDIDEARAQNALAHAQEMLSKESGLSDEDLTKYRRKLERAQLRLQLAKK